LDYRDRGNIGHTTPNKEKQSKILENKLHGHHQNIIPCVKVKHHNLVGTISVVTENVLLTFIYPILVIILHSSD
jgi:hypothetical protein